MARLCINIGMANMKLLVSLGLSVVAVAAQGAWTPLQSGVTATFRGASAVSAEVVWVSGSRGTVLRSLDAGATWANVSPSGASMLDFRDIEAFDARTAYVLSIGNGDASRILKTTDGGASWDTMFTSPDADAFFDAMAFWDRDHGIAFSDSANGQFRIITTEDGGRTWSRVPVASLPPALDNEGAFAGSGTNIVVWGDRHVWIGTGAAAKSRVLRSSDRGKTWAIADTPIPSGESWGIFSVAFRDSLHGIVVGGDYSKVDLAQDNVATTEDGGATWKLAPGVGGFRSVVTYLAAASGPVLLAVGPSGSDLSSDDGRTWTAVPTPVTGLHTYSHARGTSVGWAAGGRGSVARFEHR
jgi:photosystem II stability/assembly factor-like uncharacterized protein